MRRRLAGPGTAILFHCAAVLAATQLLAGCIIVYGVWRSAELNEKPFLTCIERVIRTTPGVATVRYAEDLTRGPPVTYSFDYEGAPGSLIRGTLTLTVDADDVRFSHSLFEANRVPSQAMIDASRPVMLEIEHGLSARCRMAELPSDVRETCRGVECPPIESR